jgi:iron complex transport system substrate-binding protein
MRIISLLASGTEFVCALGAGDDLVGRSHECDNPLWVRRLPCCSRPAFDVEISSGEIDAEVRRRLRAGEPLFFVDHERIRDLRPDLIIAQAHCDVCAVTPRDVERVGQTPACRTVSLQASSISGIMEDIARVAEAIDRNVAGHRLIADLKRRIDHVRQAVSHHRRPTVIVLEWTDPIFAMGNWGPELIEAAGGIPLLGAAGQHSRAIDWNELRVADPEVLIVAPCGFHLPRALREVSTLERNAGWPGLRAVKARNVFFADGNLYFNRSGTTIADTAEILADILHGTRLHGVERTLVWARQCETLRLSARRRQTETSDKTYRKLRGVLGSWARLAE